MALLPDHAPLQFVWRHKNYRIKRADGPERIFGEWWIRDTEIMAVRDYFQVEDEAGARFWLFRRGDGIDSRTGSHEWFLHGFFG
jgi:protein ImuB